MPSIGSSFCFQKAGEEYNIPSKMLYSIARHESRLNPQAVNWNTNGSYDYGLMQINTIHADDLAKAGIQWNSLADPCTNVRVGAWILSKCFAKYGYTWEGVGCYNSQTPSKRNRYANIIYKEIQTRERLPNPVTAQPIAVKTGMPVQSTLETVIGLDSFR
jgi:soluble lytic murein transglycosylase-like protein